MKALFPFLAESEHLDPEPCDPLLGELVAYLRGNRTALLAEWIRRIVHSRLLTSLKRRDILQLAWSLYDGYVEALSAGGLAGLQEFLRRLADRLSVLGIKQRDALALVYLLREVLGRSLFRQFRHYEGHKAESAPTWPRRAAVWPTADSALQCN